jgi:outer membrane immunogenic protein
MMYAAHCVAVFVALVSATKVARAETPAKSWAGFYAGAHGGYGWSQVSANGDKDGKVDLQGGLAGLHGGYLWQWQHLVAGVEGDFTLSNINYKEASVTAGHINDFRISNAWLASVRGRLGFDLGPALVYGTAGIAWTDWSFKTLDQDRVLGITDVVTGGSTGTGWIAGGGAEFKLTEKLIVRVEGLHYRFDDLATRPVLNGVPAESSKVDQAITTVRGGLSWRF